MRACCGESIAVVSRNPSYEGIALELELSDEAVAELTYGIPIWG
jgi:hypothetical protein